MAELVIPGSPFAVYPGGVIAVTAEDFLGPARGTLTSAVDALASSGTRVRDTQTVTTSIRTDAAGAFDEALDTLVIPLADLPLERSARYNVYVSYRIPGEWDITNIDTMLHSTQAVFTNVVRIGYYGVNGVTEAAAAFLFPRYLARIPHYTMGQLTSFANFDPAFGDTMRIRAFAQDGTTAECLIDCLIFVVAQHSTDIDDTTTFVQTLYTNFSSTVTDGADGGDVYGKFTRAPAELASTESMLSSTGGGDYQQKADGDDAEYWQRVVEGDDLFLPPPGGGFGPGEERPAHGYTLNCVRYREAGDILFDEFDRTVSGAPDDEQWGLTPEGYFWHTNDQDEIAEVGDGVGKLKLPSGFILSQVNLMHTVTVPQETFVVGAQIRVWEDVDVSGKFRIEAAANWLHQGIGTELALVDVELLSGTSTEAGFLLRFHFEEGAPDTYRYQFQAIRFGASSNSLVGLTSLPAWYAHGDYIAFRIQLKRYIWRLKIWDPTGAEPAAWDHEGFRPIVVGSSFIVYPYSDDINVAREVYKFLGMRMLMDGGIFGSVSTSWETWWDDIRIRHDPEGEPTDMLVRMEAPEGATIDEIVVPYGAPYFVYWGLQDWCDLDEDVPKIRYSIRLWNDTEGTFGAPLLQRAELVAAYFRIPLEPTIVSMNWRST